MDKGEKRSTPAFTGHSLSHYITKVLPSLGLLGILPQTLVTPSIRQLYSTLFIIEMIEETFKKQAKANTS